MWLVSWFVLGPILGQVLLSQAGSNFFRTKPWATRTDESNLNPYPSIVKYLNSVAVPKCHLRLAKDTFVDLETRIFLHAIINAHLCILKIERLKFGENFQSLAEICTEKQRNFYCLCSQCVA